MAAYTARRAEPLPEAQDGGLVTGLARHLLDTQQVEAVLVTGRDASWRPQSAWATDPAAILAAAGSKYSTSPALALLGPGLDRYRRVAVIALPCQCAALARLRQARPDYRDRIELVIGLFCSKTFVHGDDETGLTGFVRQNTGRPLSDVRRFDIRRGRFIAHFADASSEWRIKELAAQAWPICSACADLSAEFADISVGSIGSAEGRNSVVVRSERAAALLAACVSDGWLTLQPLENPEALAKLAAGKRSGAQQLADDLRTLYGRGTVRGNWRRQQRRGAA